MKKIVMSVLALTVLGLGSADAAVYKGQKVYVKKCRKCHGGGLEVAGAKKKTTWNKLLKNKGEGLAKLHLENNKAKASWKYFESKKYTKSARHLKDFMVEYAKDSGNVPACN
ncbi:c-type cytochrome [Sulfurimonas sp. HSL3-7]|uniref:c-type cytochrome n=1 Tax=Sulfonitrofixus jiaomeiensis TaxID=3131938 RepID=UPI0031F8206B